MTNSNALSPKGFTIIELVVYMGTLAIFLTIITQVFASILDVRTRTEATSSLEQDSRYILSRLLYDIQRAQAISEPNSLGDTSIRLIVTIDGMPHTYQLQGNDFTLTDDTGTYSLNSSGTIVSGLNFQRLGAALTGRNTIRVNLTVTSVSTATVTRETKNIQTTIGTAR